jgi:D-serine deaminase-like pyridoxal phosphate-dependent protein
MDVLDLDTPAPYVDLDVLERNLRRMQEACRAVKVALRPHTKTHKIPEIARMQLAAGAIGLTVAKTGEAEVMPGEDILIAYPITPDKAPQVRALATSRRVTVAIDSVEAARALDGIPALVEVDVGLGRCGVQTATRFAEVARACPDFRGLFYYPVGLDDAGFVRARSLIRECLDAVGGKAAVVSGGGTPYVSRAPLVPETTEWRSGAYVFYDAGCVAIGCAALEDCALRILATVVSTAVPGQCIIDGGSKTFSSQTARVVGGYGQVVDRPWTIEKFNEEHGYVRIQGPARVGEKVWVVPAHAGNCVVMHDEIWYGRRGRVEGSWRVAGRGRLR